MTRQPYWLIILLLAPSLTLLVACGSPAQEGNALEVGAPEVAAQTPSAQNTRGQKSKTSGEDWPTFLGPRRDGSSRETGILTDWPEEGPKVIWQRPLGTGYAIGTVSEGKYFQFDRHENQARLDVLNAETGELLWQYGYPTDYEDLLGYNNGPRCSPIVDDGRVYLYGAEGELHCLDVAEQKLLWKRNLSEEFGVVQNFFGVGSTPVVFEDLLLVMVGGSPAESQDTGRFDLDRVQPSGSCIVALDKKTGELKYQMGNDLASYASMTWAEIEGQPWAFAFARAGLLAFDPRTGTRQFHFPWRARVRDSVNASTPLIVGNEVFISETYGPGAALLKVKPGEYDVVWKDNERTRDMIMQTHWNTCVEQDGFLYGSSGRHSGNADLKCVEWKTGKVRWSQPRLTRASLLLVDDHLVCLSEDGWLRLIKVNPEKYEVLAEVQLRQEGTTGRPLLRYPAWAAPILSHGLLYVRGEDRLVCLELIPRGKSTD
ncbi:MAG: PQQ-binding-like beta-propeller repeat protein [Pirellulaceae bacterium]